MWEKVKLGEIFSVIRNGANIKQSNGASGIPITRIESISSGFLDESKLGYANIDSNKFENFYILRGDILMSHINSLKHLGKTALVSDLDNTIIHGMNLLLLRANQRCFPAYIKYFFETNIFYGQILSIANQSVNQSSFTVNKLKDLEIPLPPLPIQEKIATILDKADELRRKDKDLQAKYDELAQAIFIDMFGDPARNEKGWELKKFDYFVSFDTNMTTDFSEYAQVPHIGVGNIERDSGRLIDYKLVKDENIKSGKYIFTSNHIIYSKIRPNLNKVALPNFGGVCSADSYPLLPTQNSNKYFFSFLLRSDHFLDFISSFSNRANIPKVNKEQLSRYFGIAPPLHLQEAFAKKIELINQLKAQTNAEKSEELFQSLLQKAFKGELVS